MYEEDPRDVQILKSLLPLMSRHAAGYHPISYSVWYEHVKGERPSLRHSIDAELKSRGRLTPALTYSLYSKHLVEPGEQALIAARSNLMELMDKVKATARETSAGATRFDARLADFQRDVRAAASVRELDDCISAMISESRLVSESIGHLNLELESSQSEVKRLSEELDRLRADALIDALSGLMNRRGLDRELQKTFETGMPEGGLSVIKFDIDAFRKVNETYGHALGDAVIASVGRLIRDCLGQSGFAARVKGQEFLVALPAQSISRAGEIADAIRVRVEKGKIRRRQTDEPIGGITISAGVTEWRDGDDLDSVFHRAQRALEVSKKDGRNRVTVAAD